MSVLTILSSTVSSSTSIRVTFSAAVDVNPALTSPDNYTITGGTIPVSVLAITPGNGVSPTYVDLTCTELQQGTSYTVGISMIEKYLGAASGTTISIISTTVQSNSKIRVTFNTPVANNSALILSKNYAVKRSNTSIKILSVVPEPTLYPTYVDLNTDEYLQGGSYNVIVYLLDNPQSFHLADSFTRADNANIEGTPIEFGGMNWEAEENVSIFGVSNNQLYWNSSGLTAGLFVDSGLSDLSVSVTYPVISVNDRAGIWLRGTHTPGSNTSPVSIGFSHFSGFWRISDLYRGAIGTVYAIDGGQVFPGPANGDTLKIEALGTTIKGYKNGVLILTATTSFQQGATIVGIPGFDNVITQRATNFVVLP